MAIKFFCSSVIDVTVFHNGIRTNATRCLNLVTVLHTFVYMLCGRVVTFKYSEKEREGTLRIAALYMQKTDSVTHTITYSCMTRHLNVAAKFLYLTRKFTYAVEKVVQTFDCGL